ncbi:MAG: hypothetical protein HOH43_16010 [Candidatus Latescibacteria bacterium]|nr:hypothetical protein [Candidatus Latescibacterota bacterium]
MEIPVRTKRIRARVFKWFVALCALTEFLTPRPINAHEIPSDITIHVFVKPDGERLTLLVRLPLEAMRDMSFPLLGPGYLDIPKAESELRSAARLWIGDDLELFENENRLPAPEITAIRASIPSDRSFGTFDGARDHLAQPPLPEGTMLYWQQALLDVQFEYPISSDRSDFSIDPGLERLGLRVVTVLRFLPPEGEECVYEYTGYPGKVSLDPLSLQVSE